MLHLSKNATWEVCVPSVYRVPVEVIKVIKGLITSITSIIWQRVIELIEVIKGLTASITLITSLTEQGHWLKVIVTLIIQVF